jgi:hypothetical protein
LRIDTNLRTSSVAGRNTGRGPANGPAFLIDTTTTTQAERTAASGAAAATTSIGALLAMQAVEDPTAGKKRQVRRGRSLLDTLDALKADLVMGHIGEGHLNQLMALIAQARERSEPGLDALLDDIELRARVELAKRGLFPA